VLSRLWQDMKQTCTRLWDISETTWQIMSITGLYTKLINELVYTHMQLNAVTALSIQQASWKAIHA
jgi:hypothetical protein